jgi:4-hydroxy-3-methylbut-2-enyl diphosphate reductase
MGILTIASKPGDEEINQLRPEDIVIIPAFGTEVATRRKLEEKGCQFVDTTCGDVMSVWKRIKQYSKDSVTSIIHGKAWHEETKATSSQAGRGHYLVVFTLAETDYVCNYILNGGNKAEFLEKFKQACSEGFDPDVHLEAIGVANQTTMLRGETEEVQRRLKRAMMQKYGEAEVDKHFRFFDTICGATQDRQDALGKLLQDPLDLLLVIGGYNSSNTSHLAEMGEAKLPTYFIKNAAKMESDKIIHHYDQDKHEEIASPNWLPAGKITVGITAGASCPNNLIEDAIRRLFELRGISVQQLIADQN